MEWEAWCFCGGSHLFSVARLSQSSWNGSRTSLQFGDYQLTAPTERAGDSYPMEGLCRNSSANSIH